MKTIYKYEIRKDGTHDLWLPKGAEVVSVANVREQLVVYALVETDELSDEKLVQFHSFETGVKIDPVWLRATIFRGSVVFEQGHYVVHVFQAT